MEIALFWPVRLFLSCWLWLFRVLGNGAYRFYWDDCFSRAASLSYTTIFALVPASYIMINMLHVFGVSEEQINSSVENIISGILPPTNGAMMQELKTQVLYYLDKFRLNVQALKTFSILLITFTSISLVNTMESAFNAVWRVTSDKGLLMKLSVFWTLLSLGTVLLYFSLYSSARVREFAEMSGYAETLYYPVYGNLFPPIVMGAALTFLFYGLPSARVRFKDALFGGVISSLLFEFVKWGFAFFMGNATTYSTIYGVLAAVPLFLFWMYVAWCVVLFGAEVAYQAGSMHIFLGLRKYSTELGEAGVLVGLKVLLCISKYFVRGEPPPSESEIAIETGTHPVQLRNCLDALTESGLLSPPDPKAHRRTLVISPERLTVDDVVATFRSKEYRLRLDQARNRGLEFNSEQVAILEMVRNAALSANGNRETGRWTLAELIKFSPVEQT